MNKTYLSNKNIYLYIAATVIFFNLIAVFGLDILLHDDPNRYRSIIQDDFPEWMVNYSYVWAHLEWYAWHILTYSPTLARGLYVLLFMVPLSICFYYLWHRKFGFSPLTAFTAAVLPNILPQLWQIPAGINMSYTLYGLLTAMASFLLGIQYLENSTSKNYIRLVSAALLFFLASQMIEHTLFLFPPIVLAFLGCTKLCKKHIWLISLFSIIALALFIRMTSRVRMQPQNLSLEIIISRIESYFNWALPFSEIKPLYIIIVFFSIILVGFLLSFRPQNIQRSPGSGFSHMSDKFFVIFVYSFLACWSVSTIIAFIIVSPSFSPRYTHISSFGLIALFIFSLYQTLNTGVLKKLHIPFITLIAIVIYSGLTRYSTLSEIYEYRNKTKSIIVNSLTNIHLPTNAQIVIVGAHGIPGGWFRSTGYLMHALERNDVSGLLGAINNNPYYNFDNHFTERRGAQARWVMTGLAINKPTFLYKMDRANNTLMQVEYALQWKGASKNAPWSILQMDKTTGLIQVMASGIGMEDYLSKLQTLEKHGILQSDILWGGPASKSQLARLLRTDLDPSLMSSGIYSALEINPIIRVGKGKVIDSKNEKDILEILVNITTLHENTAFGSKFRLVSSFIDDIQNESSAVIILWQSMVKQKVGNPLLTLELLKTDEKLTTRYLSFIKPNQEINSGDLIVTYFLFPTSEINKAEKLGITFFATHKPHSFLTPKSKHSDKKGRRLLVPLK